MTNKNNTYKTGDTVKYLGHPARIKAVRTTIYDDSVKYCVRYDTEGHGHSVADFVPASTLTKA